MWLNFAKLYWKAYIEKVNLKYDLGYYLNENIKRDFGVNAISHRLNPGEVEPTSASSPINPLKLDLKRAVESGAYISAEHKITDKLTANYGLRLSHFNRRGGETISTYANNQPVVYNETLGIYERADAISETFESKSSSLETFTNLEPRLGLSYQLNDLSSVKASYTRSAQYLHLLSNTSSVTPLDVWTPSGPFVKPQLSNQYAVGYYRNFADKMFSLEVEAYYKTVDNRIDYIDGSDLIGTENIEREILNGEARAYGLEFLLKKNTGKFTGWLSYTLAKSEQRTPGGSAGGPGINGGRWYNTPYDRTHDFSLTGSYKLNDKWSFGGNLVFQTGRPVTYPNGQYQYEGQSIASFSPRNSDRLPTYHRLDISATYKPNRKPNKRWKGEWVFGIYNVYNRKNAASISFSQNQDLGINEAMVTIIL